MDVVRGLAVSLEKANLQSLRCTEAEAEAEAEAETEAEEGTNAITKNNTSSSKSSSIYAPSIWLRARDTDTCTGSGSEPHFTFSSQTPINMGLCDRLRRLQRDAKHMQ